MPSLLPAVVTEIVHERDGLQKTTVDVDGRSPGEQAYVLTKLIGPVRVNDKVVVNTRAVELGLGTGGTHVVHWNLSRTQWAEDGPGHIMKLRYTSLQSDVGVAEEVEGFAAPESLDGLPVVVCLLHSQLAAVAAAVKMSDSALKVAYVMSDQAALPIALSDLVHDLKKVTLIDTTITAGQAFGGDLEAVNVTSGLGVAVALAAADVVVVAPGPGVVGSSTRLGFGGLDAVSALDMADGYGGTPIFALRWSDADPRPRHRGLSHHAKTVLQLSRSQIHVAIPNGRPHFEPPANVQRHLVDTPDVAAHLEQRGIAVRTMGRLPSEDDAIFAFAAAAGAYAASLRGSPPGHGQ